MAAKRERIVRASKAGLHAENKAIYLPAISAGWAGRVRNEQFQKPMPFALNELDFLLDIGLFYYPFALYSVGQNNTKNATVASDMVSLRDRANTIILGDSGGYQVSQKAEYFSPAMVDRNMRWMEAVADYSMVLDFPTGGISGGAMRPHIERLKAEGHDLNAINATNGLGLDYNACLLQTKLNNDDFVQNHTAGATRFLNVLQGRSEKESSYWYQEVKHYPFSGWAFAGHHQNRFSLMLARLMDMWDDGSLAKCEWIHVLGISTTSISVLLTVVQREIRKHVNPDIQISFDTSSPFQVAANQQMQASVTLDHEGWSQKGIFLSKIPRSDDGKLMHEVLVEQSEERAETRYATVTDTAVSKLVRIGDLRNATTGEIDQDGYDLLTGHNVEAFLDDFQRAHDTMFSDLGIYMDIKRPRPSVPLRENTIAKMVELVFADRANARKNIRDWAPRLDALRTDV